MDINLLMERLQILNAQMADAKDRMTQAVADINAINGAIQECNFWINFNKQEQVQDTEQE